MKKFLCILYSVRMPRANVCTGECQCSMKALAALQEYFHFQSFRSGQKEAVVSLLHNRDVVVQMATGSGKSLCMFLPPLSRDDCAMGVVISPLNGLMDQQVYKNFNGTFSPLICNTVNIYNDVGVYPS